MRIALLLAAVLLAAAQPASAQVRNGQQFPLVTRNLVATLIGVEVQHVQIDNTIDVAVVLRPSGSISQDDSIVAAAEFCIRYGSQVMAAIRAEGTRTRVHVFVPLFSVSDGSRQTDFGFSGETCPLDPPFPRELRAAAARNAAAALPGI